MERYLKFENLKGGKTMAYKKYSNKEIVDNLFEEINRNRRKLGLTEVTPKGKFISLGGEYSPPKNRKSVKFLS